MLIPEPDLSPYQFLRPLHLIRVEHERQLMIGKELSRLAYLGNLESVTEIGGSLLEELDRDHAAEKYLMRLIVIDLDRTLGDKKLESSAFFFDNLGLFARGQQRHLAWENDLVLPLASKRLCSGDLAELGRNMAARRRITLSTRGAT